VTTENRTRSVVLWLAAVLGMLLCVLLGILVALPWVLSTSWGSAHLALQISRRIPGEVKFQNLHLTWLRECTVENAVLRDAQGHWVAEVPSLRFSGGLLGLLQSRIPKQADVSGARVRLEIDRLGRSNLEKAIGFSDLPIRHVHSDLSDLPVEVDHLALEWLLNEQKIDLVSSALCRQGNLQGSWRVDALFSPQFRPLEWEMKFEQIPTELLDLLASFNIPVARNMPSAMLGDFFSLYSTYSELDGGTANLKSPSMNAAWDILSEKDGISIALKDTSTALIAKESLNNVLYRLNVSPDLAATADLRLVFKALNWSPSRGPDIEIALATPVSLQWRDEELSVDQYSGSLRGANGLLMASSFLEGQDGQNSFSAKLDWQMRPSKGSLAIKNMPLWLGQALGNENTLVKLMKDQRADISGSFGPQLPHPWHLNIEATGPGALGSPLQIELSGEARNSRSSWVAMVSSPAVDLRTSGHLHWGKSLSLAQSHLVLRVQSDTTTAWGLRPITALGDQAIPIQFTVSPMTFREGAQAIPRIQAQMHANAISLGEQGQLHIDQLKGLALFDPSMETASWQLTAEAFGPDTPKSQFALALNFSKLMTNPLVVANIDAPALPMAFLIQVLPELESYQSLIGNYLGVHAELEADINSRSGTLTASLKGKDLKAKLPLQLEAGRLSLKKDHKATASLKLTSQTLSEVAKSASALKGVDLVDPWSLQVTIKSFEWEPAARRPQIIADVSLDATKLTSADWPNPILLGPLALSIADDGKQQSQIHIDGQITYEGLQGGINCHGHWMPSKLVDTFEGELLLHDFPTAVMGLITRTAANAQMLSDLVGQRFNIEASISGPVSQKRWELLARSPYIGIAANGWMAQGGLVGLDSPLQASWTLSPDLQKEIIGDYGHIFAKIDPLQTIAAQLDAQGTRWDTKMSGFAGVVIPSLVVDPGKLSIGMTPALEGLFNFLNTSDVSQRLEFWSTPFYGAVDSDVLTLQRTDILLAGRTHVAMWGRMQLATGALNLTLGLPGDMLAMALTLGTGDPGRMMTINVGGTIGNPQIDWAGAAARLTAGGLTRFGLGGPAGMLVGSLLDRVTTGNVPPPTMRPLPWRDTQPHTSIKDQILRDLDRRLALIGKGSER